MPSASANELFQHAADDALHDAVHPMAEQTMFVISQYPNSFFANMNDVVVQYCSCLASHILHDLTGDAESVNEEVLDQWQLVLQAAIATGMQAQQLLHAGVVTLPASPITRVVVHGSDT